MSKDNRQALADTLASKRSERRKTDRAAEETRKAALERANSGETPFQALNVKLPPDLHAAFKAKAESEGRTMTYVAKRLIGHYLSKGLPPAPES